MRGLFAFAKRLGLHLKLIQHSGKWASHGHWRWQHQRAEEVGKKADKTKRTLALCKAVDVYGRPLGSSYRNTEILSNFTNALKGQGGPVGTTTSPPKQELGVLTVPVTVLNNLHEFVFNFSINSRWRYY